MPLNQIVRTIDRTGGTFLHQPHEPVARSRQRGA